MNSKKQIDLKDYQSIFKNINDLICIINTEGYFRIVNSAFHKLLGWTEEELFGVPFTDFIHPEDLEKTSAAVAILEEGKILELISNRYRTKTGEYLHINWQGNIDPASKEIIAIGRNITHQHYKNQEFELLSKVVSRTKDVVVITDTTGKIVWVKIKHLKN